MNEPVTTAHRYFTIAAAIVIAGGFVRMMTDERPVATELVEPAADEMPVPSDGPVVPEGLLAAALLAPER